MKKVLVLMMGIMFISGAAMAEDSYGDRVRAKLDYGLKNLLGGWTEIITEPLQAKENGECMFTGLGNGIMNAVSYTLGGALHTATFIVPDIDVDIKDGGIDS